MDGPTSQTIPFPLEQTQQNQSSETQAGTIQTGADLLNNMTQQRLSKLYATQDQLNQQIQQASSAAATPVPSSGVPAVKVPGQHQWQNAPLNTTPAAGHRASVQKGIGNLITGVANVVGAYETKKQNEKNKALSIDIERILEAQAGINSAQEILKQDPQNKDANDTKAKNQDIINSLLGDDKKRKQIGKAFDINFTDPSQNNTPEHAALKTATKSYAEQLQTKLPQQMAPNKAAQEKLGLLQKQQELITEQIKAASADKTVDYQLKQQKLMQDAIIADKKDVTANKKIDATTEHWDEQLAQRNTQFAQKLTEDYDKAKLMSGTRLSVAAQQASASIRRAQMMIDGRLKYADKLGLTGSKTIGVYTQNLKTIQQTLKDMPTALLQAQTLYNAKDASPEDKKWAQNFINTYESKTAFFQQEEAETQVKLSSLLDVGNKGDSNGSGSGSSSNNNSDDHNFDDSDSPNWQAPRILNPNGARPNTSPASSKQPVQTSGPQSDTSGDKNAIIKSIIDGIKNE